MPTKKIKDIENAIVLLRGLGHDPFCPATQDALLDWVEENPSLVKEFITSILPSVEKEELDKRFAQTEYVIEATSFEMITLWRENDERITKSPRYHLTWKEENPGCFVRVGYFLGSPINVAFFWSILNGHRVMFYETTSHISSGPIIAEWLDLHCNPYDQYECQCRTNAMNFGSCIQYCTANVGAYKK